MTNGFRPTHAHRGVLALLVVSMLACQSTAADGPGWIENPNSAYPELSYLVAVGSGESLESASANATGALAQIFETRVDQVIRDRQATDIGPEGTIDRQSIESDTKLYTKVAIEGVEIKQSYKEKGGPYWALAVLDKDQAADALVDRIRDREATIRTIEDRASGAASPLVQAAVLEPALAPASERDSLAAQLRVVSGQSWPPDPPTPELIARIENARADTRFAVNALVLHEDTGAEKPLSDLRGAIAEAVSERGYRIVGPDGANVEIDCRVELSAPFERGNDGWVHYIWQVTIEVRDRSDSGPALLVHQAEGSSSHPQASLSRKRAFLEIKDRVLADFMVRFDETVAAPPGSEEA